MSLPMLPTFSATPRAFTCGPSSFYPQIFEPSGPEAIGGNALGVFFKRVTQVGRDRALEEVEDPADRVVFEKIRTQNMPLAMPGVQHELALSWDADSRVARILGVDLNRAYDDPRWCARMGVDRTRELVGSLDTSWMDEGRACVPDWKRGWGAVLNVAPAADNLQILIGTLAFARVRRVSNAQGWVVRVSESGWVDWEDTVLLDELSLMELEDRIADDVARYRRVHAEMAAGKPQDHHTGRHCNYCRAYKHCPSTRALMEMATTPGAIPTDLSWEDDPEKVTDAYEIRQRLRVIDEKLAGELKAWQARCGPIPLRNGMVYGKHKVGADGRERVEAHYPDKR